MIRFILLASALALAACGEDEQVAASSKIIKGELCELGTTLAVAAAEKRGIPVGELIGRGLLAKGCKSLADRLPISGGVFETKEAEACAQFGAYRGRLSDAGDQAQLDAILADAGCA